MSNVEFVSGQESHSSNWGKYYVKGLETWQCKEDGNYDKHHTYTEYQCNNIPEHTVFTLFEQSGNKRGTEQFFFSICITTDAEVSKDEASYGDGKCAGNFKVICRGEGKVKAPRLMTWWTEQKPRNIDLVLFAEHCAKYIDKRGTKDCPPMESSASDTLPGSSPNDLEAEVQKLINLYGLDEVKKIIALQ